MSKYRILGKTMRSDLRFEMEVNKMLEDTDVATQMMVHGIAVINHTDENADRVSQSVRLLKADGVYIRPVVSVRDLQKLCAEHNIKTWEGYEVQPNQPETQP